MHPANISLEQWLIATGFAMVDQNIPSIELSVMLRGNLYTLHHHISSTHYPNKVGPLTPEIKH